MSLGQTMLSIATLVALTVMVVTSQRYLIEGQKEAISAECLDLAAMHSEALLAEISRKNYDLHVTYDYYQPRYEFTGAYSMGPSSYERSQVNPWPDISFPPGAPFKSNAVFNDVDDYNNYYRTVNTQLVSGLQFSVKIYYVSETNPEQIVWTQTYLKMIEVTVQHPTYLEPISFSTIVSY